MVFNFFFFFCCIFNFLFYHTQTQPKRCQRPFFQQSVKGFSNQLFRKNPENIESLSEVLSEQWIHFRNAQIKVPTHWVHFSVCLQIFLREDEEPVRRNADQQETRRSTLPICHCVHTNQTFSLHFHELPLFITVRNHTIQ